MPLKQHQTLRGRDRTEATEPHLQAEGVLRRVLPIQLPCTSTRNPSWLALKSLNFKSDSESDSKSSKQSSGSQASLTIKFPANKNCFCPKISSKALWELQTSVQKRCSPKMLENSIFNSNNLQFMCRILNRLHCGVYAQTHAVNGKV